MRAIDTHAHIFPDKIVRAATESISTFYGGKPMAYLGTSEQLLHSGTRAGVEKFLVFSTATTPQQVVKINDFILSECAMHPEFITAGTMHRDFENPTVELERIRSLGVRGIKLHPDFQRFNFDDDKMLPVYAALDALGMFVITHAGDLRFDFSNPERIARIAERFPTLKIIAAHLGGWSQWELARRVLNLPNLWFDTSSVFGFEGAEPLTLALKVFDHRKIFFGVDFPMWDHQHELDILCAAVTDATVLDDIVYNNFNEFYGGLV